MLLIRPWGLLGRPEAGALIMPSAQPLLIAAGAILVVVGLMLLPLLGSRYAIDVAHAGADLLRCSRLSLNVLIGYTGNISFGHAAYFAIGGYACAILLTRLDHWPLILWRWRWL